MANYNKITILIIVMLLTISSVIATTYSKQEFKNLNLSSEDLSYSDYVVSEADLGVKADWLQNSIIIKSNITYDYYFNTTTNKTVAVNRTFHEPYFETVSLSKSKFLYNEYYLVNGTTFEDCQNKYSGDVCNQDINDWIVKQQEAEKVKTVKDLKKLQDKMNGVVVQKLSSFQIFINNFRNLLRIK